jgi:hypothetical protein
VIAANEAARTFACLPAIRVRTGRDDPIVGRMASLGDVFREIDRLKTDDVIREYALDGATAVLFYAEPARTYDVDVFVLLPQTGR